MEILLSTKVTINNFLFRVSQSWSRGAGLSRAVRRLYDLEMIREGATVLATATGATLASDTFFDVELWREAGDCSGGNRQGMGIKMVLSSEWLLALAFLAFCCWILTGTIDPDKVFIYTFSIFVRIITNTSSEAPVSAVF